MVLLLAVMVLMVNNGTPPMVQAVVLEELEIVTLLTQVQRVNTEQDQEEEEHVPQLLAKVLTVLSLSPIGR